MKQYLACLVCFLVSASSRAGQAPPGAPGGKREEERLADFLFDMPAPAGYRAMIKRGAAGRNMARDAGWPTGTGRAGIDAPRDLPILNLNRPALARNHPVPVPNHSVLLRNAPVLVRIRSVLAPDQSLFEGISP
jgi:hypothetical protein